MGSGERWRERASHPRMESRAKTQRGERAGGAVTLESPLHLPLSIRGGAVPGGHLADLSAGTQFCVGQQNWKRGCWTETRDCSQPDSLALWPRDPSLPSGSCCGESPPALLLPLSFPPASDTIMGPVVASVPSMPQVGRGLAPVADTSDLLTRAGPFIYLFVHSFTQSFALLIPATVLEDRYDYLVFYT